MTFSLKRGFYAFLFFSKKIAETAQSVIIEWVLRLKLKRVLSVGEKNRASVAKTTRYSDKNILNAPNT
jgi:hypothetical protein